MTTSLGIELYKKMYLIRRAEESIIEHYQEDDMKTPMHMSMGAEAIAVGICHALRPDDQVLTSYRSHAVFLAKTGDTDRFFGEMYGRVTGTADGRAGSMHLAAPDAGHMVASGVVASYIPMALGLAFANRQKRNGRVVAVFFGDGALDEGVFWESLNVACIMKLPILLVCEDNGFSVQTPTSVRQGYRSITDVVSKFNCKIFPTNREAWDKDTAVEAIYSMAKTAIEVAKGGTPCFLHLKYYRYLEHLGVNEDWDDNYRPRPAQWPDPVVNQRRYLTGNGTPVNTVRLWETAIEQQIANSLKRAREASLPEPEELFRGVFYEKD